jgi:hypothetical protein
MICDDANKLTILSLGPWPEDRLRHAYPSASIRLTSSAAGFGGKRNWFLCPHCDRRCSILYDNPARGWVCRICGSGRYASEVESPIDRLYRKARKLRCRLGQMEPNMQLPFPGKPTSMHWSTYLRLRKEGLALEARLIGYIRRNLPDSARRRLLDRSIETGAEQLQPSHHSQF